MALKQNIIDDFSNLESIMDEYAQEYERLLKEKLEQNDLKATGDLIDSISVKVRRGSEYWLVTLNSKDYIKYVEKGRSAGKFPPMNAILKWIRAKKILPSPDKNNRLPTENQLAFLISRSIAQHGTIKRFGYSGPQLVYKTTQELNSVYIPRIEAALQADAEHFIALSLDDTLSQIQVW